MSLAHHGANGNGPLPHLSPGTNGRADAALVTDPGRPAGQLNELQPPFIVNGNLVFAYRGSGHYEPPASHCSFPQDNLTEGRKAAKTQRLFLSLRPCVLASLR